MKWATGIRYAHALYYCITALHAMTIAAGMSALLLHSVRHGLSVATCRVILLLLRFFDTSSVLCVLWCGFDYVAVSAVSTGLYHINRQVRL